MDQEGIFRALSLGRIDLHGDDWQALLRDLAPARAAPAAAARLGALVALGGSGPSIEVAVESAIAAGVTADEVLSIYLALAEVVGTARVIDAAHSVGLGLGIDVDRLLEDEGGRSA